MSQEPTTVTRNTTIDAETDAIVLRKVEELFRLTGTRNYSAALRAIVREWDSAQPITKSANRKATATA